ncbi:MAG: hypothetical protein ACON4H_00085 [Rubripirellula sp.]
MRLFTVAIMAICTASYASGGISYYSNVTNGNNNGSAFSFTFTATPGANSTWLPMLSPQTAGGITFTESNSRIELTSNGQPGTYQTVFSEAVGFTSLGSVTAGSTVTFNDSNGTFGITPSGSTTSSSRDAGGIGSGSPIGVNAVTDEYFVWAHYDSSTYAVGWAKYTSPGLPTGSGNNENDVFTISEWAYNLTSSYSSIVVGDTNGGTSDLNFDPSSSSGSVPEPTGMAILGLAATILSCTRKRVR